MSRGGTLEAALLLAHAAGDRRRLIALYAQAADGATGTAAAFYMTHAYVFALEAGDARADGLHAALVAMGAETQADAAPRAMATRTVPQVSVNSCSG